MTQLNIGIGSGGVGTAVVELTANLAFPESSAKAVDYELKNANSPMVLQSVNLNSGANTVNNTTFPDITKAGGVIIIPPSSNTATLVLKGVTGDMGVALSKIAPTVLTFDTSPPSSFVVTAGASVTGLQLLWF